MAFVVDGMGIVCGWYSKTLDDFAACFFGTSGPLEVGADGRTGLEFNADRDKKKKASLIVARNFVSSVMHMQGEHLHEQRPSSHRPIVRAGLTRPCLAKGVRRIGCLPCNDVAPTRGDHHST